MNDARLSSPAGDGLNRSHTGKILSGSLALLAARGVFLGAAFVRIGLIARFLGVEEFGTYTFAMSFTLLFLLLAELGLPSIIIREGARRRERIGELVRSALKLRGTVLVGVLAACLAALRLTGTERKVTLAAMLLGAGLGLSSLALLFQSALRAIQRMELVAMLQVARELATLALIYWALVSGGGIVGVCAMITLAGGFALAANVLVYAVVIGPVPLGARRSRMAFLVREGLPAAVPVMVPDLMINVAVIMLASVRGRDEVAYVGAALRFVTVCMFIPGAFQGAVYPILSELFESSAQALRRVLFRSVEIMIACGMFLAVATGFLARDMIVLVYGSRFEPAARALVMLSPSVLFVFVSALAYPFFVSINRQRLAMVLSLGGFVLTASSAFALSKGEGFTGTALAVMMGAGFLCCSALFAMVRLGYGRGLGGFIMKALGAGCLLAGVLSLLQERHALIRLAAGALAYVLALLVLKGFTSRDIKALFPSARGDRQANAGSDR